MEVKAILFDLDNTLLSSDKLDNIRRRKRIQELDSALPSLKLFSPVCDLLQFLESYKIPLAIVTNSPRWYAEKILNHFNIKKYFSVIITYDDVTSKVKPSEYGIELALEKLSISEKNHVIYIGDSDDDIEASYRAGVIPFAPAWAKRNQRIMKMPASVANSEQIKGIVCGTKHYRLFAEECVEKQGISKEIKEFYYAPLDYNGFIVCPNKKDIEVITLGRYFPSQNTITHKYAQKHKLTLEITKKSNPRYSIPDYIVEMFCAILIRIPRYFGNYEIITVIPSKKGSNPRLENMLESIAKKIEGLEAKFITDLFFFEEGAISLKGAGGKVNRLSALQNSLKLNEKYVSIISGKKVLIIDDVITTGATISYCQSLLEKHQVQDVLAICLAKTVSLDKTQGKICPRENCEGQLVSRKSQYGEFYGCTNFYTKGCTHKEPMVIN